VNGSQHFEGLCCLHLPGSSSPRSILDFEGGGTIMERGSTN